MALTVLATPQARTRKAFEMNDISPKLAELLTLAKGVCAHVARTHDGILRVVGCSHLSATPPEMDETDNWAVLGEIHDIAVARAKALAYWYPPTTRPCACAGARAALPLVEKMGHTWAALARTLAAVFRAAETGTDRGQIAATREVLTRNLSGVEAMTNELLGRTIKAHAFVEAGTDQVKRVFDRAAAAGCAHIPAAVTGERTPVNLAALDRLRCIAWDTHQAIEAAASRTYGDPDDQDDELHACCTALPAATTVALVKLTHTWAANLQSAWQYVLRGEPKDETAMSETAAGLAAAADDLLKQTF